LILSDGKAGHLGQALAAATIAGRHFKERGINSHSQAIEVKFKNSFSQRAFTFSACLAGKYHCQGCLWCMRRFLTADSYKSLTAKKYDLIISCGSGLAAVNFILSRENLAKSIVIMRPSILRMNKFDLVVMPRHDKPVRQCLPAGRQGLASFSQSHKPVSKKNTVLIDGALNLIDEGSLKTGAEHLGLLANIAGGPVVGMLIGGDNKSFRLSLDSIRQVISQAKAFSEKHGAVILVTTSRRTPKNVEDLIRAEFRDYPRCKFLVIANEKNPPFSVSGILGASQLVVISPESISMISEAAASRRYVLVFGAPGLSAKHKRFLSRLRDNKYIYTSEAVNLNTALEELWGKKPEIRALCDSRIVSEAIKGIL
jgi:mitochondrial fission protein ELM1